MPETDDTPMLRWLYSKPLSEIPVGAEGNFAEINLVGFDINSKGVGVVIPKRGLFKVMGTIGEESKPGNLILIEKTEGSERGTRWLVSPDYRFQQVVPVRPPDQSVPKNLPSLGYRHLL